jgi:short-subunit dehydrogenase
MIKHNEEGHVLNTISLAGILPGEGIYGVSKHAALALSESLWQGLRDAKSNIGASVLCPGFVNTNIVESNTKPGHKTDAPMFDLASRNPCQRDSLSANAACLLTP